MRLEDAHQSWTIDLRSRNLSARTLETYSLAVTQHGDWLKQRGHYLDVAEITTDDVRGFIGHMLETRSPATPSSEGATESGMARWSQNTRVVRQATRHNCAVQTFPIGVGPAVRGDPNRYRRLAS